MNYDFKTLSDADFEDLTRDLIGRLLDLRFEAFCAGSDGGMEGRHSSAEGAVILQAKHYAGSSAAQLKAAMKQERASIDALEPARYLLATSRNITHKTKAELAALIGPSLKSEADIFGPDDLNKLLRDYPDLEKAHIKFWLSSAAVLDRVVNAAAHTFAAITRDEIEAKVRVYAQNPSFSESAAKLEDQHVLIVSGPAGVGKTTLAEMLSYAYLAEGWELVPIRSLDDGFASLNDARQQVFLFDDFLGRVALDKHALSMKDSDLARFIKRVRGSANGRFILTTRAYILEEARRVSEHLADQRLDVSKYILDVGIYTRRIRARILYNHLLVAETPLEHIRALIESGKLADIVDHKNYNPRVIEWMTDRFHIGSLAPADYPEAFLEGLRNPKGLWDTAFRTHIDDRCRHLLFALFFCSEYGVDINDARASYDALHQALCDRYGLASDPKDFEEAVRILEGGFIAISGDRLSFINPSFRDYLTEYLDDQVLLREFAGTSRRSDWAEALWQQGQRGAALGALNPELAVSFVDVAEAFKNWPTWKRYKAEPRSMVIADGSNASRLKLILDWWNHCKEPRLVDAALALASAPPDGWDSWRDSEPAIELISQLRDGDYFYEFPVAEELAQLIEAGLIKMLKAGVSSDDIEKMSDAIEENQAHLAPDIRNAMNQLIADEFAEIYQRTSDMDSESTLDEYLDTLTRLAPRASIPEAQITRAADAISDRKNEVTEKAERADGPGFTLKRDDKDPFDDSDVIDLFMPLLSRASR